MLRISNYVRRTPERSPPMHSSMVLSGESKTNAWLKAGNGFGSSSDYVDRMQHSPPCGASTPESEPAGGSSPSRSPYNPPDDFRSKFTTIYTDEQRKAYKAEFAKEYAHYLKLHDKVSKVSSRFAQLENELQKYPDYTSRYQVRFHWHFLFILRQCWHFRFVAIVCENQARIRGSEEGQELHARQRYLPDSAWKTGAHQEAGPQLRCHEGQSQLATSNFRFQTENAPNFRGKSGEPKEAIATVKTSRGILKI